MEHYLTGFAVIPRALLAWLRLGDRTNTKETV